MTPEQHSESARAAALVAHGIRALRVYRGLTQHGLAELMGTDQSCVARWENPDYRGWTFKVLIRIAGALRARVRVRFVERTDPAPKERA